MSDERAEYLASASGSAPSDVERLDAIRSALAAESTWAQPPPDVAGRVLDAIEEEVGQGDSETRRWGWIAAAAALILIVLAAGLSGVFTSGTTQYVALAGTDLQPDATGTAWVGETGSGWWIKLEVEDLPAADEGTYYEGWVWNDDGEGVSIGTFHLRGGVNSIELWSGVDPAEYPSIWITLEDEDGNPSASNRVVMRGSPTDT
ncbi:MAG: anti-sigma factor [Acidimicrobiia bacterium]|jgi:hypothetical protein